jgi:hypothetical protein
LRFEETSADPTVADVDNDGDLDLYATSVYPGRYSYLYLNDGIGKFTDVAWLSGTRVANGWGTAFADYDRDGDMDLLVGSEDGVVLLDNPGTGHHWLSVAIRDRDCNHFGVGAWVSVRHGAHSQTREVFAGKGSGTQDSLKVHFGFGQYAGPVELEVRTLCGRTIRHPIDREVTVSVRQQPGTQAITTPKRRHFPETDPSSSDVGMSLLPPATQRRSFFRRP